MTNLCILRYAKVYFFLENHHHHHHCHHHHPHLHFIIMIKVENYLMLSEYEQNLLKETEGPVGLIGGRRGRR